MKLKRTRELYSFLTTWFSDADMDADDQTTQAFAAASSADTRQAVMRQLEQWIADAEIPVDELGSEANRWFSDEAEARAWLERVHSVLQTAQSGDAASSDAVVKDSNGTVLNEGDSVTVIKDLKVKGGSSDLKRGTMIKKIHLIGDPDNIECRVDGSTLVLKTMFLKKA